MTNILYTMGYTGSKPEYLAAAAEKLGARIMDIRYAPYSRHHQWNRQSLGVIPGYEWVQALGNINYKSGGGIRLANEQVGVAYTARVLAKQPVILVCACAHVETCHRKVAADLIQDSCGCEVVHLTVQQVAELAGQAPDPSNKTRQKPLL